MFELGSLTANAQYCSDKYIVICDNPTQFTNIQFFVIIYNLCVRWIYRSWVPHYEQKEFPHEFILFWTHTHINLIFLHANIPKIDETNSKLYLTVDTSVSLLTIDIACICDERQLCWQNTQYMKSRILALKSRLSSRQM